MAVELNACYAGSSTKMMKDVVAAALRAGGDDGAKFANQVEAETDWRFQYPKHFRRMTNLMNEKSCTQIAEAGLAAAYQAFTINGKPLAEMVNSDGDDDIQDFKTLTIKGEGQVTAVEVQYKNGTYAGDELLKLVTTFSDGEKLEKSCLTAITQVLPKLDRKLDDKWFVLLGAGSEIGPCEFLLQRGANVVALRTRKVDAWKALVKKVKSWPGTLYIPTEDGSVETAGCDLIGETHRALRWVRGVVPANADLTVGYYIYLDGVKHVTATMACDLIMTRFQKKQNARLAYICSPTVSVPLSKEMKDAMQTNRDLAPWYVRFSGCPALDVDLLDEDAQIYLMHGYMTKQGPNYALAKTLQNFRALLSPKVSWQLAPASRTLSVTHNSTMEKLLGGFAYIPPMEVFDPDSVATICGLLLMSDVFFPKQYSHPMERFMSSSFHGGFLRVGFSLEKSKLLSGIILGLGTIAPR
eukprot:GEMP01027125.1.p1 GENE.GEMP01027125.1~~GEMP01027125.1.p1  ORF type:complete len:475 (-),score=108.07 GEMP01027125.1:916-2319(-)